jgi:NAD dependent epimerase/dehydratase family enzyme
LLASQRVEPVALVEAGYTFRQPEVGPALVDLLGSGG